MRPLDVILSAAVEASLDLDEWRHEDWSDNDRNEQWVHSYLAIRLNDYARKKARSRRDVLVTLESKVSWLDTHCDSVAKRGRPSLRKGQRFDLAVWRGQCVEGLVEVKNAPRAHDAVFGQDVVKLSKAIHRWGPRCNGTLRWGVFLFSAIGRKGAASAKQAVIDELKRRLSLCGVGEDPRLRSKIALVKDLDDCRLGWGAIEISEN